ncbi:SMP-30/gluconolactonase/LRE family protein [Mycobacterium sp. UM_Kg1]|uniref:SMP-30/gluconolactonase/LRE family protein n=1 Tax=Mycobacterium sp. UM_Kg1 TaxID=1545691 RepID=UPI00061AFD51|nr:SMP-30/gluconolactonase/LRE family protein [Mycobacterium sp. UM_Kg1]
MPEYRLLADGLDFPEGPVAASDGSVVVSEMAAGRITKVLADGTRRLVADVGGGPNGIGRLPDGALVVCQNGGSRFGIGWWPYDLAGSVQIYRPVGPPDELVTPCLQLVDASGSVRTLTAEFVDAGGRTMPLVRPSDVCVDDVGGFYVTDGGTTHGRSRTLTGLLYGTVDGALHEVVYPLEMPNGVAISPDGSRVYVAETRTRRVWEFELSGPGRIRGGRGLATVASGGPLNVGGADGLCVAPDGTIVVATLGTGGVTAFSPSGNLLGSLPLDDPLTTNVTVDPDGETLYVTLAGSGRLVAIDGWRSELTRPRP